MADIESLSVVALSQDLPEHGLIRRQVWTLVENLASGVYEVEFCNNDGRACARLHHEPLQ